jgi:primosomal protein N' (replication factor Y)
MIVKGHDFPDVTLVGILAADMSLYAGDYRASERTFQLLTQAAGRAGRGKVKGEVVIQTYTPDNYSIVTAANQDYDSFYNEEIAFRQVMGYPPVMNMLLVTISSKDEMALKEATNRLVEWQKPLLSGIQIIGPADAAVYKLKDIYSKVIYAKSTDYELLTIYKDHIEKYVKLDALFHTVSVQFNFN